MAGLFEELATDEQHLTTQRGTARLWALAPTVCVTSFAGHMDEAHGELFMRFAERRLREATGRIHVFNDWTAMTGYDSQCRTRLTSWSMANLPAYGEVHMAVRSKIVAMGVQVANLALGGKVRVHASRVRLEVELRRALKASEGSFPAAQVVRQR